MKKALLLSALAGLALATSAQAQALPLGFDDGTGTASVDQFTGTDGSGWSNAWAANSSAATNSFTGTVVNTTPLVSGGGNYLQGQNIVTVVGTSTQQRRGTNRSYDGVDLSADLTVSFDFRIDSTTGWNTAFNDAFYIHSTNNATNVTLAGDNNNTTWNFLINGEQDNKIRYYDGTAATDTGETWTLGAVYSFEITSYAATETYDFTILENGSSFVSITGAAWRAVASLANTQANNISFVPGVRNDNVGDQVTFSVDNISVTAIPEPSSFALMAGALGGLALLRRRKA